MDRHTEIIEEVERLYQLSDKAVHAILMRFILLEADEQTLDEL